MSLDLSGVALANARKAAIRAVPTTPTDDWGVALAYADAVLIADSKAICEYIVANNTVQTTSGAPDGEHTGAFS